MVCDRGKASVELRDRPLGQALSVGEEGGFQISDLKFHIAGLKSQIADLGTGTVPV
jgi:hypothetical protein